MKLLHTGDLHLGKSLHEHSVLEDQKHILDQLVNELRGEDYAALIIAGDVYDRTVPPAEAVALFSAFLADCRDACPEVTIAVIPGNHDSAKRLAFADRILGTRHIHIICNPEDSFTPIILSKGTEKLALFLLPFLAAGTLQPEQSRSTGEEPTLFDDAGGALLSQAELAREASRRFSLLLDSPELDGIPAVLAAHLFTTGGAESSSERIFLGTAEQVSPALFSRFAYTALGHLHRFQKITDRMYYAGSPLAYAFDEAETVKVFLRVEIDTSTPSWPVSVEPIPFQPLRAVRRLSGSFDDFYSGTAFDRFAADYLEICLDDHDLVANPVNLLKPKFPWLLSLKQGLERETDSTARNRVEAEMQKTVRSASDDFKRFQEMLYGNIDESRQTLFEELLAECTREDGVNV